MSENVKEGFDKRTTVAITIALLVILFLAVNTVANVVLRQARVDLTENGLFTLSDGTIETLRSLEEPIRLQFFYSETLAAEYPTIRTYASRVRDLLEEYEARSGGMLDVDVIDPEPFTEAEDLANAQGLTGAQTQTGEVLFFGLVGTNAVDGKEIIPFFPQERAPFLEYDLTSLIHSLNTLDLPVLGILTSLPLDTGTGGMAAALQGQSEPLVVYQQLQEQFEIAMLSEDVERIPADVDVLMIAHPKELSDRTLYAIDQFVLGGGRALVFVDPQSGLAAPAQQNPFGQAMPGGEASSDLGPLLGHWGLDYDPGKVVADLGTAQAVATNFNGRQVRSSYVIWLGLTGQNLDQDDLVTADIETLNLATTGFFGIKEDAVTEIQPLITSSDEAMLLDKMEVAFQPQPEDLLRKFLPTGKTYVVAARVRGEVATAFPNGQPAAVEDPEADEAGAEDGTGEDAPAQPIVHRETSDGPINVIVVADSDLFDDRFWVVQQSLLGQRISVPTADNGNFVINAVENLTGSNALISLRSRASGERPFELVEAIRRRAETKFLAQEQQLATEITALEQELMELQGQRDPTDPTAGAILTPEQERLVEQAQERMLEKRQERREVQRALRADIEALGGWLAFINIALVPLVVAGVALALSAMRAKRRAARLRTES